MYDKTLAIIRATMRHFNEVQSFSFRPCENEVGLILLQSRAIRPDFELSLTFSGVRSFVVENQSQESDSWTELLGAQCTLENGIYQIRLTMGYQSVTSWVANLAFTELRYKRVPCLS